MSNSPPRLDTACVPQADRILRVGDLVRAAVEGVEADLDQRDLNYYRGAARILGLLDRSGSPTTGGIQVARCASPRIPLREAFEDSDVGRAWLAYAGVGKLRELDPESAEDFLAACTSLSRTTIVRRAATLRAWWSELVMPPVDDMLFTSDIVEQLCTEPLTEDELELAEALRRALRGQNHEDQITALADVLLAALLRLDGELEEARSVVAWLNRLTPDDWRVDVRDALLADAVRSLERQDYRVLRARLETLPSADVPTQVIEFDGDADAEDACALETLMREFARGAELGAALDISVSAVGTQSRMELRWPAVSTANRPTAPLHLRWLRRPTRPHTFPYLTHGTQVHITTLHHVAALAMSCGAPNRMELLDCSGVIARWSTTRFENSRPAYRHSPGVLVDDAGGPDQTPWLWWRVLDTDTTAPAPDPAALLEAVAQEPSGGQRVLEALEGYASELPPLEFGPAQTGTAFETDPPEVDHMVIAPTGSAIRLSVPNELPTEIRRDLLLHALGHILLGHVRPDSTTAFWDSAATIRLGANTRPLDADVQTTFADWFPTRTSPAAAPTAPLPVPVEQPAANNETFFLALRALLALEPWHVDPFFGLREADVDPLPHQISAVYDHLLTGEPLRTLLADDPGAGKTIMAGLLIRERRLRGSLKRCLIVAPGGLVDQWQGELEDRFGLEFEQLNTSDATPFGHTDRLLLVRLDQLARNKGLLAKLDNGPPWDLVVVDEAHKLSAQPNGRSVDRTARYRLGEQLHRIADDLLLMTATPHNGVEGCFQLSLALLDRDRFCGPYQEPFPKQDTHDILLRRIKEDLVRFDGSKLFPERFANTVAFELEAEEQHLYESLTTYVREEMNRVSDADAQTANRVGFAMQVLQRRLASSPRAIHISLQRRRERLQQEVARQQLRRSQAAVDRFDELTSRELELFEDELAASVSAARSSADLKREIRVLDGLERQARQLLHANVDSKWRTLRSLLEQPPLLDDGHRQKLVLFTESRDTLNHLREKLKNHFGRDEAVTQIHGGTSRKQRREAVTAFMTNPSVKVLIANDAAGEGVNLQGAHFLVNYDLPWNPNRLEQRFGRIHRIGQDHTCLFFNLLARGTREGDVYIRLLEKLEVERKALGGRVYDVLGELFEGRPLSEILRETTLGGTKTEDEVVERVSQHELKRLLERGDTLVAKAEATPAELKQRLDASNLGDFLNLDEVLPQILVRLGGRMREADGHWTVRRVPGKVQRMKDATGRRLPRRYDRLPLPVPRNHALARATVEAFRAEHRDLFHQGVVLEAELELTGPVPAMLLEVAVANRRTLCLVGWSEGALLDLRPHLRTLAPSTSTDEVSPGELDDAVRSATDALISSAIEEHQTSLPRLNARRKATTGRLERAIDAQEAHVEHLAQQRDQDPAKAREELLALERRLQDAQARFDVMSELPDVEVTTIARFTIRDRGGVSGERDAADDSEQSSGTDDGASTAQPTPHEVQEEALKALAEARGDGKRSGMVVMATGLGKTWLSAFDFRAAGGKRGLFIAHRDEILSQAAVTWARLLPDRRIGFFDGERKDAHADLVFASIGTLSRRKHLQGFAADAFDYIVVDEFHHAAAASYRRVIHHFTPSFLLGMTATPDRTDGASLLALCGGNEIFRASLVQGVSRGLLSPFHYYGLVSDLDYDKVNWRSGRFDLEDLTDFAKPWTERAWARFIEHAGPAPRRTLVFCCTTRHADHVAAFLREKGVKAVAVHSKPSSAVRATSLAKLRDGSLEAICCVDVFNEGVDVPELDHVLMLRPTESPIVFLQQLGRGLRTSAGKDALTVVDFIGNHRSFLLKPAVLMQLTGESPGPSASVQRLKQHSVRLPAGCSIEVETAAIDLLEQLARRSPQDVLVFEYRRFWDSHGRRPSAGELFAAGANLKAVADNHGNWFDFVASQEDLDPLEQQALANHRGWLDALWALGDAKKKVLPSSFPLLVLQVMLDEDAIFDELPVNDVVAGAQLLADSDPLLRSETVGGPTDLRFWSDVGPGERRQFEVVDARWLSRLRPDDEGEGPLESMTGELVDLALRCRRHRARLKVVDGGHSWLLKVSHGGNDRPMLWLHRDKNLGLPLPGTVVMEVEDEIYEADVVSVALNVVRPRGGGPNALPELLRSWFGPRAGGTGTRHFVRLEQLGTHFRLSPDRGVSPVAQQTGQGMAELAFFPDQRAACGLHPTVDLRGEAPVSVPVAGDLDPRRHFLVKADGDSMDGGPRPIRDGALALCRWFTESERNPANVSGPCLLIGRNGGEPLVTIKTPEQRDGRWWLVSRNPSVPDEPVRPGMRLTPVAEVLGPAKADLSFRLWRGYKRQEIAVLFGSIYRPRDPVWSQGYVPLDNFGHCASALFVTLRKGAATKKEHRYRDGFSSRSLFLWETQNRMGRRLKSGRRHEWARQVLEHSADSRQLHLFSQTQKREPFIYCGTLRYLDSEEPAKADGKHPMRCSMELENSLPDRLWSLWGR